MRGCLRRIWGADNSDNSDLEEQLHHLHDVESCERGSSVHLLTVPGRDRLHLDGHHLPRPAAGSLVHHPGFCPGRPPGLIHHPGFRILGLSYGSFDRRAAASISRPSGDANNSAAILGQIYLRSTCPDPAGRREGKHGASPDQPLPSTPAHRPIRDEVSGRDSI